VNASSGVSVGGITVNVTTDGLGQNSGPATKTWVDANITIAADGTNNVNVPHTFTVTVKKDAGDGNGLVAAAGETVTYNLANGGTANTIENPAASTCDDPAPNLNASGQCIIVFTSPTVGTTTGNAFVTLTVGGVTLTRDTDPATANTGSGPGGSGPAVKTWITVECPGGDRQITSNFNGTAIAFNPVGAGSFIWFNSIVKATGLGANPVTVHFVNQFIDFTDHKGTKDTADDVPYHLPVPDADIIQ
jgi:hypothetical protein